MARLIDKATTEENHRGFIRRVIANQTVWYLSDDGNTACSESNYDEETTVLLFWSDEAYAKRAQKETFEEYGIVSMDLFDLLFRWLPGMSGDGVLAGTNWTGDLIGIECDPFELREEIEEQMPEELHEEYQRRYEELTK